MQVLTSLRGAVASAFGTGVAWLFVGLFNVLFWTLSVFVIPIAMIYLFLQRSAPGIFGHPGGCDPEDVAAFNEIWEDLSAGNLDALAAHAERLPDFPNGQDMFIGRPWLTNAVDSGSVASVGWVLDQGVDPNYQDDEGYSPLMSAVSPDNATAPQLVALLLARGADPNFKVTLDRTALHAAACQSTPEVAKLLLDAGADPFAYDSDYVPARPIDDARSLKRHDVVALLEERMAET